MRIGMMIGEISTHGDSLETLVEQTQWAEREGLHSAWFTNIFGADAMTAIAVAGRVTARIELGTAVVPIYPRHPVAMAQQALTTQAATQGRFLLGIGLAHQFIVEPIFGLSFARSYTYMKEYLGVLAPLIRRGAVDFDGEVFHVHATLRPGDAGPCPILLAAMAPKMLTLAGAVGEGTVTWMTGPKTLQSYVVPRITAAAAAAGMPPPRIVAGLPVAVTSDVAQARATAATTFVVHGNAPSYRAMLDREGAEGPADIVLVGDEAAVTEQVEALAATGVTDFLAYPFPVGGDAAASLDRTRALIAALAGRAA